MEDPLQLTFLTTSSWTSHSSDRTLPPFYLWILCLFLLHTTRSPPVTPVPFDLSQFVHIVQLWHHLLSHPCHPRYSWHPPFFNYVFVNSLHVHAVQTAQSLSSACVVWKISPPFFIHTSPTFSNPRFRPALQSDWFQPRAFHRKHRAHF
jgi:hypothetical protein